MLDFKATRVALLGRGAFSQVTCHRTDGSLFGGAEFVAIKRFDREASAGRATQILEEKKVLAKVGSADAGIVRLLDSYKDDDHLYLVFEACLHGNLAEHLAARGGLARDVVRVLTAEAISVLEHLAAVGCVHRDLKSKNCLIDAAGHLKICDFGSAKVLDDRSHSFVQNVTDYDALPRSTTVIGTPHAMAPEMVAKCGYSYTVDWWALGILLFEMVYGYFPFERYNRGANGCFPTFLDVDAATFALKRNQETNLGESKTWDISTVFEIYSQNKVSTERWIVVTNDLIVKLLVINPARRLSILQLSQAKAHEFFQGFDWHHIDANRRAPLEFDHSIGVAGLLSGHTHNLLDSDPPLSAEEQELFKDF